MHSAIFWLLEEPTSVQLMSLGKVFAKPQPSAPEPLFLIGGKGVHAGIHSAKLYVCVAANMTAGSFLCRQDLRWHLGF